MYLSPTDVPLFAPQNIRQSHTKATTPKGYFTDICIVSSYTEFDWIVLIPRLESAFIHRNAIELRNLLQIGTK